MDSSSYIILATHGCCNYNCMKYIKRYIHNFLKFTSKKYYQDNHPDGRSYPPLLKRLIIFWKLKNELTTEERWATIRDYRI